MTAATHRGLSSLSRLTKWQLRRDAHHSCKVLVVGGGTGGCAMAAKMSRSFKKRPGHVIVVEPSEVHYYQPIFTLVGGGLNDFDSSRRPTKDVLPKNAQWIRDKAVGFEPDANRIVTSNGDTIDYEIMIIAMGLQLLWDKIPGLTEALDDPKSQVCSIYSPDTVTKVFGKIKNTRQGLGIFTFPNTPVKCPGAPQKICYIAEDYWRRNNLRNEVKVVYNTSLPVIFGVKKYADALWRVCESRGIEVNLRRSLVEIRDDKREAIFQNLNETDEIIVQKYSFLHVCPPMGPPEVLKRHGVLTNEAGFLSVDPGTLRHARYDNIYGIGDCTTTPNSKTMAAIASQSKVLYANIMKNLSGKDSTQFYNGYASCPLVTGPGKCILAEFDYNLQPMETFPIDQKRELWIMYMMKKYFFPFLYWNFMLKGYWNGPEFVRKYFTLFSSKNK